MAIVSGLFASGFGVPIHGTSAGGFAIIEAEEYIQQQVMLAIGGGDSANPFQDFDLTDIIFTNIDDPSWRTVVANRIRDRFHILELANLARFISLEFDNLPNDNGDLTVRVEYLNLEGQQPGEVFFATHPTGDFMPIPGGF